MRALKRFLLVFSLLPTLVVAQGYPTKAVKIIVPAQPGGGLDLIGRTVGAELGKMFDQQFVIENVGGGGGSIACQQTARAAPDGYTLMGKSTQFWMPHFPSSREKLSTKVTSCRE